MAQTHVILAELSRLETEVIALEKDKQEFADKKTELLATIEEKESTLNSLKAEKTETQKNVDALNLSVGEFDQKLKELEDKRKYILSGGGKNADLAIITEQQDDVKADQSVLEDKVCELWEKIDSIQENIDRAAAEFNSFKESVHSEAGEIDKNIGVIGSKIDKLASDIKVKLEDLKGENREAFDFYTRLQDKSVRPAAIHIANGNCQGCFLALPPDVVNKIHDSIDLIKCPNCYRFLFVPEEEPEEAETE